MSRTLSELILENFVINECPKWDKFKSGAKKVGTGAKVLAALGAKGEKKKQEKKSLKENLNMVKSEMLLNEAVILAALAATIGSLGLVSLLTGSLAKLAIKMETKEKIKDFANSLRNGKDSSVTVDVMNIIVKKNGSKEEKEEFKKLYDELLSLISRGKLELTVATDKKEVLDKRVHNVTGFLQKDEEDKKKNKFSDEKSEKAYSLIKRMYEIYKSVSDQILQPKKQEKKSLKERLELVKSGMFLNEEPADITTLRNKISQGLILLPGLKGASANKMEDSIRG